VKVLFWLLFTPFAVLTSVFAVNNRGEVALSLDPFPYTLTLPVYLAVLSAALFGFLMGTALVWIVQGRWRRLARRNARQVNALERDLSGQREESTHRTTMAAEAVPSVFGSEIAKRK
jgi:uncharacterized integral membrane protein